MIHNQSRHCLFRDGWLPRIALAVAISILWIRPTTSQAAGPVTNLDDIEFWVGSGSQQAALVIDWDSSSSTDTSLTWGFRWEGTVTAADMFLAIVAADQRLFAKVGDAGALGMAVYGIGYDGNGDNQFELDDTTSFDADGLSTGGPSDLSQSIAAADPYREGWFLGYWHHGIAAVTTAGTPSGWMTGSGLSARTLSDGDWDSLAYTNSIFDTSAFADRLWTAEADSIPGDYDRNGIVDASDFTVWRNGIQLGTPVGTVPFAGFGGDGNRDAVIDADDYDIWTSSFGNSADADAAVVPEPANGTLILFATCFFTFVFRCRKRHPHLTTLRGFWKGI